MAKRWKTVQAVGWGQIEPDSAYRILELGDPRHAVLRVSTEQSMSTGRYKEWDVIRSHLVEDMESEVPGMYLSKYFECMDNGNIHQAMNWITMGWASSKNVRYEGELSKVMP